MIKTLGMIAGLLVVSSLPAMSENSPEVDACWHSVQNQQIRTAKGWVQCTNRAEGPALRARFQPDLVTYLMAQRMAVAEKIDRKSITLTEGVAQIQTIIAGVYSEAHRRNALTQQAQSQQAQPRLTTFCNTFGTMTFCQ